MRSRDHSVPDAADDHSDASAPEPARRVDRLRQPLRWATVAVNATTIVVLTAASVLMMLHHRGVEDRQRQEAEYITAARQGVVTLMSLNFNTVDDDIKRIIDNSTGEFKKDFEDHAGDFAKMARDSKAVTETTSTAAGIESLTDTDAVVLVAVSTKVSNSSGATDEPRNWRLSVEVTRDGDQIKMSKVDFAP